MSSLPLSWSFTESQSNSIKIVGSKKIRWYAIFNISNTSLIENLISKNDSDDLIIRGCNSECSFTLQKLGFSSFQFGMEAVLDTKIDHFKKKSIKKLISRGKKHGIVKRFPFNEETKEKLDQLISASQHGAEPQLINLFQTEFSLENDLFVFVGFDGIWKGAILVSKNSEDKLHTELILRRKNSPIGITEMLVYNVFNSTKEKGYTYLSLGEVPFLLNSEKPNFSNFKNFILWKVDNFLNFAYSTKGLYNFKNKFQPKWNNLYICTSSKLKLKHLFFLFINSNLHKLVSYKLFYIVKKLF